MTWSHCVGGHVISCHRQINFDALPSVAPRAFFGRCYEVQTSTVDDQWVIDQHLQ